MLNKSIGKKIMAHDRGARRMNIGYIINISDETVEVYCPSNPAGYRRYTIPAAKFVNYVEDGRYALKTPTKAERGMLERVV